MTNWPSIVINAMLGGELPSCRISVLLTWLEQHTSYSDHAVTCHVSAIQKDARLSLRNLPGYPNHLWSNSRSTEQAFVLGWASVMEQRFKCIRFMIWISEELDLFGIHLCAYEFEGNAIYLSKITWILSSAWETLALSLAVWIAMKHFRELQRASTGWSVGDCYTILMQTHVFYFARWGRNLNIVIFSRSHPWHTSFIVVSCIYLIDFSPNGLVCHLWLTRLHPTISHYFHRAQIRSPLISFLIFFQLPKSCRCLCWDHVSSLVFDTIRLNSWPTPTRESPWPQLLSRSAYKFQLAVACSVEDARIVNTHWIPYGPWGTHEFCLVSFVVILITIRSSILCTECPIHEVSQCVSFI